MAKSKFNVERHMERREPVVTRDGRLVVISAIINGIITGTVDGETHQWFADGDRDHTSNESPFDLFFQESQDCSTSGVTIWVRDSDSEQRKWEKAKLLYTHNSPMGLLYFVTSEEHWNSLGKSRKMPCQVYDTHEVSFKKPVNLSNVYISIEGVGKSPESMTKEEKDIVIAYLEHKTDE